MDQLTAHLDHGWELAQRGDAQGAASSARRAIELDPDSPEGYNLLGYAAVLAGELDEALEAYQQALVLDETYVEAMLNAAELYLYPLCEFDEVIQLCEQVAALAETEEERVEATLLKFEAYLGSGRGDEAKALVVSLPEGPFEISAQNFLAGKANFDVGDYEKAERFISACLKQEPNHAEAHYYAGLLKEQGGDRRGAIESFLHAREIELMLGMPEWAPNGDGFLMFLQKAIENLPDDLRKRIEKAEFYVADLPGPEVIVDGVDPRAVVLVDAPAPELADDTEDDRVRVFVYAVNVIRAAGTLDAVQHQMLIALQEELAAVFLAPIEASATEQHPPKAS